MKFDVLYEAGSIRRFHTKRVIQDTTVAHHTWGVCLILLAVCDPSKELIRAAMFHDMAEVHTGDIPAPAKWENRGLHEELIKVEELFDKLHGIVVELRAEEQLLLKWADMMELILYCRSEIQMGNAHLYSTYNAGLEYLKKIPFPTEAAKELFYDYFGD